MKILNPIYDTAFKYLMEDIEIAKGLISTIIEEEIEDLIPAPQEQTADRLKIKYAQLELQRLDYVAVIKSPTGTYQKVIIEVQKSPFTPEIGRFRNYLAEKYKRKTVIPATNGKTTEEYLHIKTIYMIDETFNHNIPPILKRDGIYIDVLNNHAEYTAERDQFVELLNHESWFIQVRRLPNDLQSDYLRVLSVFAPWYRSETERCMLEYPETDIEKIKNRLLRRIITRLLAGAGDTDLKRSVELEIEYEDHYDKLIADNELKTKIIVENKKTIEEKEKTIEENKKALEENKKALEESARVMKSAGIPLQQIATITKLSVEMIAEL